MACLGTYLTGGNKLKGGDWLLSPNGQYSAVMQDDGNFVLYWGRYPDRLIGPMWATDTDNKPGATLTMQTDGNLVLSSGGWMSGIGGKSGPLYAAMQDNGDFALWTGTPDNPGTFYWTSGTWQGTLAVEVDDPFIAHVMVGGKDTGHVKQGRTNRGLVHFPILRNATADFSVYLGAQHFATIPLGARRSLLYSLTGTADLPKPPNPVADHGPF